MMLQCSTLRLAMHPTETIAEAPARDGPPPVGDLFVELSAGLADSEDLEALLKRFLEPVLRLAGAKAGAVRALSEDGTHMRLVGSVGLPQEIVWAERSVDRHCGVCGEAADHGALVSAGDLAPCMQRSHGDFFTHDCKRLLAVPLRHRDHLLGIYNLFFDNDAEPGPEIAAVLRSVGELLGLALHNARLEREHLRAAVLHERQMLAGDVHDAVAQTLYYMKMRLPLLHDAIVQHDDQHALKYHADLRQAVSDAHASLREILTHYRTRMNPQGLLHAVRALQAGYRERTGIELVLDIRVADLCLTVDQELQVFHIVQESLANVSKHSGARRAVVRIEAGAQQLEILIEDDGEGLRPGLGGGNEPHFGLEIMRERAQRLGGSLNLQTRKEGGTRVHLRMPYAGSEASLPS
jgi:two-component system nitrate/nitrite sensor histidine kinase NarX